MGFIQSAKYLILRFDHFGVAINIKHANLNVINTPLGSMVTITLTVILIVSFSSLMQDILNQGNPQVIVNKQYEKSPTKFLVKPYDFDLAFMIMDRNNKILTIEETLKLIKPSLYFSFFDLMEQTKNIKLDIIPCNQSLDRQAVINQTVGLVLEVFSNGFCVDKKQWKEIQDNLYLIGGFTDQIFSGIYFNVSKCLDVTLGCTYSEQSQILQDSSILIALTDTTVNQQSPYGPFESNYIAKIIKLNLKYQKNYRQQLEINILKDQINPWYFYPKTIEYQAFKLQPENIDIDVTNESLLRFSWYMSNQRTTYIRTYPNILNILGSISGLYTMLFNLFGLIVRPIVVTQSNIKLIKEFINLHNKRQKSLISSQLDNQMLDNKQTIKLQQMMRIAYELGQDFLNNFWMALKILVMGNPTYNEALQKINKVLDFSSLVKQQENLQKLKRVLFKQGLLSFSNSQSGIDNESLTTGQQIKFQNFEVQYEGYDNQESDCIYLCKLDSFQENIRISS